ncbi:hypothetical protein [Mycolicibacterium baixiangningiae]|uniref:hypothetical protein n=1 Tax=Mycolicibacterium baixiangningiae TaxID=2761578 RepID=UPI0018677844|nr:hypothetical protein [Mycolicibacterium baixiangningiae]
MSQPDDLLRRVADFMRAAPEPGWDASADRVIAAVRATPPAGGWPLRVHGPVGLPGAGQGRVFVSDQVLRSTLAVVLRRRYVCAPTAIEFVLDGDAVRAVHIDVTGRYGTSLPDLADEIRRTTEHTVSDLLGTPAGSQGPIDITISDVVAGDPIYS